MLCSPDFVFGAFLADVRSPSHVLESVFLCVCFSLIRVRHDLFWSPYCFLLFPLIRVCLPSRQALVICLKLLRDITARGQIPDSKKVFQSLAAACLSVLEKSDNIVLLTTVMGFVKDWLLKEPPLPNSPSLSDEVGGVG